MLLTSTLPSPSSRALVKEFLDTYHARHIVWEPFAADDVVEAQKRSYGRELLPSYRFDKTKFVVSIDSDFLGTYLTPVTAMRQWSKVRKIGSDMARLVAFESMLSLTGMNADDRYRIRPSQQLDVAMGILNILVAKYGAGNATLSDAKLKQAVAPFSNVAQILGLGPEVLAKIADELWKNRGQSLVIAGGITTRTKHAVPLQVAVNLLNSILGNDGKTVDYQLTSQSLRGSHADMAALISDMNAGKVKTIIIHGINPIYSMPNDSGFAEALRKVATVIYTGDRIDETGKVSDFIATYNHPLENWGDLEAKKGVISIQQPTIMPLYNTRAFQDSMISWIKGSAQPSAAVKGAADWHEYLKNYWNNSVFKKTGGNGWKVAQFEDFWIHLLQNGVYDVSSKFIKAVSPRKAQADGLEGLKPSSPSGYELVLYPTIGLADGSLANVSWLQEFPDPVTKICWDNYLNVSPATAHKEGLEEGDIVKLKVGNKAVEAPVHIQAGLHDGVFAMAVGYGRTRAGEVGNNIGVNAFNLASFNDGQPLFAGMSATFAKVGSGYTLANVQHNNRMQGRQLIVEATLAQIMKDPNAGIERKPVFSIWPKVKYTGHKWAMAIDLNTCTGCSACMVACMSENNF